MIKTAMILAAGEGRRMRPLTRHTPKPLLDVGGKRLIEWHLMKLKQVGIERVVINVAYLGEKIIEFLGCEAWGLELIYSREPTPLETGGALNHALPLLGQDPFLLVNGDVWTDLPFSRLLEKNVPGMHLVLIDNPAHHAKGDFALQGEHVITGGMNTYTFSGISLVNPQAFSDYPDRRKKFPLREVLDWFISKQRLSGEYYAGEWLDVGTPERLQSLRERMSGDERAL